LLFSRLTPGFFEVHACGVWTPKKNHVGNLPTWVFLCPFSGLFLTLAPCLIGVPRKPVSFCFPFFPRLGLWHFLPICLPLFSLLHLRFFLFFLRQQKTSLFGPLRDLFFSNLHYFLPPTIPVTSFFTSILTLTPAVRFHFRRFFFFFGLFRIFPSFFLQLPLLRRFGCSFLSPF